MILTGLSDGMIVSDLYAFTEAKGLKALEFLFEMGEGIPYLKRYKEGNLSAIEAITNLKRTLLRNNDTFLNQWFTFNTNAHMKKKFDKLYAEHGSVVKKETRVVGGADYSDLRRNVLRAEQFLKWFRKETTGLDPGVVHAVISYVLDEPLFPGKRGTGIYTDEDIETYESAGNGRDV